MAIETLVDVRCPSEFAQSHTGEFDKTFLEYFEAKNCGEPFGTFNELTNKDWMGQWANKKTVQVFALCLPLNISIKANSALFNQNNGQYGTYAIEGNHGPNQIMPWLWSANKWVGRSTAEYLPWWKNAQYISTTPADDQVLHALWLHKGQKALLCVSNLKSIARNIDVQLNLAELGMKSITVEDAITGEKIEAPDGKMNLDVDFERFRLLKISAKP
jgi:hypothetical protein